VKEVLAQLWDQAAGILAVIREEIIPRKLNIIKFQRELIKQGVNSGRK